MACTHRNWETHHPGEDCSLQSCDMEVEDYNCHTSSYSNSSEHKIRLIKENQESAKITIIFKTEAQKSKF